MFKKTVLAGVMAIALMAPVTAMAQTATGQKVEFLSQQSAGERLASQLIGLRVLTPSGEELGDVNDLIMNTTGQTTGLVIGVGGFLGIAEKNVAITYDRMETMTKDKEVVVVLQTTKAELEAAPDYRNVDGQPVSVSKRLSDEAQETYQKAKEQASETYNKAKENVSGEKKVTQ
jgi:sporulation protein YlmC with PRC-barrel domain